MLKDPKETEALLLAERGTGVENEIGHSPTFTEREKEFDGTYADDDDE